MAVVTTAQITLYDITDAPVPPDIPKVYLSMDDDTGAISLDNSGNGWHATLQGAPALGAGYIGKGFTFNGTSQYLSFADKLDLASGTICLLFKQSAVGVYRYLYGNSKDGQSPYGGVSLLITNANVIQFMIIGSTGTMQAANLFTGMTDMSTWHSIQVSWSGTWIEAVLDGMAATPIAQTVSVSPAPYNALLGRLASLGFYYWPGQIDEFILYSRPLSTAEKIGVYYAKCLPKRYTAADYALLGIPGQIAALAPRYLGKYPYAAGFPAITFKNPGDFIVSYSSVGLPAANSQRGIYLWSGTAWAVQANPTADMIGKAAIDIMDLIRTPATNGVSSHYIGNSTAFETLLVNFIFALDVVVGNKIRSSNFVTGATGFQVDSQGHAEFNDIAIRNPFTMKFSQTGTGGILTGMSGVVALITAVQTSDGIPTGMGYVYIIAINSGYRSVYRLWGYDAVQPVYLTGNTINYGVANKTFEYTVLYLAGPT